MGCVLRGSRECEEPSHPIVQPHRGRSSLLTRQTTRQKSPPDVSRWCVLDIPIYEWSVRVTCMCANTTDTNTRPQIHDHSHRYTSTVVLCTCEWDVCAVRMRCVCCANGMHQATLVTSTPATWSRIGHETSRVYGYDALLMIGPYHPNTSA